MFSRNSRYSGATTYVARNSRGQSVLAVRLPLRERPEVRGLHPRADYQRLDVLAAHYLGNATEFWRLCDASETLAPDALAARERVAIPKKER